MARRALESGFFTFEIILLTIRARWRSNRCPRSLETDPPHYSMNGTSQRSAVVVVRVVAVVVVVLVVVAVVVPRKLHTCCSVYAKQGWGRKENKNNCCPS